MAIKGIVSASCVLVGGGGGGKGVAYSDLLQLYAYSGIVVNATAWQAEVYSLLAKFKFWRNTVRSLRDRKVACSA